MGTELAEFRMRYRQAAAEVAAFITPARQEAIAKHNPGLAAGRTDLAAYLTASEVRYARAVDVITRELDASLDGLRVLDVGGFLGAFPLALARCQADVTMAEVFEYYGGAFDDLRDHLEREGVRVQPDDFTEPQQASQRWTVVTNMAMLEHLADSPRTLMANLRAAVEPSGLVLVEVPNIAYWPKRLDALLGRTVHPDFDVLYDSEAPFLGHHREYTADDLRRLMSRSGIRIRAFEAYNYSMARPSGRGWIQSWRYAPTWFLSSCHEVLLAAGSPIAMPDTE